MLSKSEPSQEFLAQRRAARIWKQCYIAALRGGFGITQARDAADRAIALMRYRFPLINIAESNPC